MTPIFTRYLYFKEEVINSLIWSILDKEEDESLFWAYELYFSRFKHEIFQVLDLLYERFYKEKNPSIGLYLNHLIKEWDDNQEKHYILGDIVNILLNYRISLTEMMRNEDNENGSVKNNIANVLYPKGLSEKDLHKHHTLLSAHNFPARKILELSCKYPIRRVCCSEIGLDSFDSKKKYKDNWIYYSWFTPLWNERIIEFHGNADKLTRSIIFEDEDMEEEFYEKYDYDTDEQSLSLKNKIWSSEPYSDISLADFYKKYGSDSVFRTVKIHKNLIKEQECDMIAERKDEVYKDECDMIEEQKDEVWKYECDMIAEQDKLWELTVMKAEQKRIEKLNSI